MTNTQLAKEIGIVVERINAIIEAGMVTVLKKEKRCFLTRDGLWESELYAELDGSEAENIKGFYQMGITDRKMIAEEFNAVQELLGGKTMPIIFC